MKLRDGLAYRCDILDASALRELDAAEWDRLSADALDPNPFYARRYVLAGLAFLDEDAAVEALAIRAGEEGKLVGLLLYHRRAFPLRAARGALNRYQMSGVPLLDRHHAAAAVEAWFTAMARGEVPARWQLPHLDLQSGFARLCRGLLERHAMRFEPLAAYDRPRLTRRGGTFASHVEAVFDRKRHKELQRSLRRLREQGEVRFERISDAGQLSDRLEDFLAIEHAGWKGRARTSFLSDPQHAQFLRDAIVDNPDASIDVLLLDEQPIALSLNLATAGTLFTPKCAYDETFRRYSPGLLLEYFVIEAFYADASIEQMDAATTVDGHLVGTLWNARQPMGSVLIGRRGWETSLVAGLSRALLAGRQTIRHALGSEGMALAKRVRREAPDALRRLAQFGQGVSCLLLAV